MTRRWKIGGLGRQAFRASRTAADWLMNPSATADSLGEALRLWLACSVRLMPAVLMMDGLAHVLADVCARIGYLWDVL